MLQFTFGRFHAKEYPSYDKQVFPYNMGFCQRGTFYHSSVNVMYGSTGNTVVLYLSESCEILHFFV